MIALVSGATKTLARFASSGVFGQLHVPGDGNAPILGVPWACDNGAFTAFDEPAFLRMLDRYRDRARCLWVTAPDVVADADATLALFEQWEPRIRAEGYPVALVAQDGLDVAGVPWRRIDALFIGGTTEFKIGPRARELMREASSRGKLVHVGRVNSARRVRYLLGLGVVDSFDGSSLSQYPEVWFPWFANLLIHPQTALEVDP